MVRAFARMRFLSGPQKRGMTIIEMILALVVGMSVIIGGITLYNLAVSRAMEAEIRTQVSGHVGAIHRISTKIAAAGSPADSSPIFNLELKILEKELQGSGARMLNISGSGNSLFIPLKSGSGVFQIQSTGRSVIALSFFAADQSSCRAFKETILNIRELKEVPTTPPLEAFIHGDNNGGLLSGCALPNPTDYPEYGLPKSSYTSLYHTGLH